MFISCRNCNERVAAIISEIRAMSKYVVFLDPNVASGLNDGGTFGLELKGNELTIHWYDSRIIDDAKDVINDREKILEYCGVEEKKDSIRYIVHKSPEGFSDRTAYILFNVDKFAAKIVFRGGEEEEYNYIECLAECIQTGRWKYVDEATAKSYLSPDKLFGHTFLTDEKTVAVGCQLFFKDDVSAALKIFASLAKDNIPLSLCQKTLTINGHSENLDELKKKLGC